MTVLDPSFFTEAGKGPFVCCAWFLKDDTLVQDLFTSESLTQAE